MVAAADFRHDDRTPTPLCLSVCPHLQPKGGTAFRCWRQTLNPNAHPFWKTQKADNDTHKSAEWSPQRKGGGERKRQLSCLSQARVSLSLTCVCVSLSSGCRQIDNVQTFGICADGAAAGFCSFSFLPSWPCFPYKRTKPKHTQSLLRQQQASCVGF
jgi:hypothetical protein